MPSLIFFWNTLQKIKRVNLKNLNKRDWYGQANVEVILETNQSIIFEETGIWEKKKLTFTNRLRWTYHSNHISLEHLRFGIHSPYFLIHFEQLLPNYLYSVKPHICGKDQYLAHIYWSPEVIHLIWEIEGPQKKERICGSYQTFLKSDTYFKKFG